MCIGTYVFMYACKQLPHYTSMHFTKFSTCDTLTCTYFAYLLLLREHYNFLLFFLRECRYTHAAIFI